MKKSGGRDKISYIVNLFIFERLRQNCTVNKPAEVVGSVGIDAG